MLRILLGVLALPSAVLAMLGAMTGTGHAQETVKIGVILPYTGQFSDTANQMDSGIKLYMKEHGDTVAGKRIEIVRKDVGGSAPDVAKRLAQELLIRDGVDVLGGFSLSPNAAAVADVSASAKKLMVIMNATTSTLTLQSPYVVRVSLTLGQNCESLGTWAYRNGVKRLYTMVSGYSPGFDAEEAIVRTFKQAGGEVIGSVRLPLANPDFSAFVQRARDLNPDGIFIFVPGGVQPPALAKALAEHGLDPQKIKLMGQGELADDTALKSMGDGALGIITAFHYDHAHPSPANKAFVEAYNADYGRNPNFFAVGGYDGMHLIYEALKKTGGKADGDSLIAAAKGMTWESPRGPILIDPETRDVVQTIYIRRVEKVGDRLVNAEIQKFEKVKDPVKEQMKLGAAKTSP
jgi:branched-chain amino acid transport system substrate-binding protein